MNERPLSFRRCGAGELEAILAAQEEAFALLEDSGMLRYNGADMLCRCLSEPHYTLGAFGGQELAAFAVLYAGGATDENLGRLLGLDGERLVRTANLKLVICRPPYRGAGLGRELCARLEPIAAARGYTMLCATVSPDNRPSLRTFDALGYERMGVFTLYGGLERVLFSKPPESAACRPLL